MILGKLLKAGLFTFIFVGFVVNSSFAQQGLSCSERLSIAEDSYEEGKLSGIADLLNKGGCFVKGGYTKEEQVSAYRLMALVSIFNDDEIGAEESVINLLIADPEHSASEDDPVELELLFEKYRSDPIFRIGVKLGTNFTFVNSMASYSAYSSSGGAQKEFNLKPGFVGEITGEFNIIDNLDVLSGYQYSVNSYEVTYDAVERGTVVGDDTEFTIRLNERLTSHKIPVLFRYHYDLKNISPYVLVGTSFDYLASALYEGERKGSKEIPTPSENNLKNLNMRNTWNLSYLAGFGIKIRTNKVNFFVIEGRYSMGAFNIVNGENRYAASFLNYDQAHVDDDKSLNSFSLSLGYLYSIYNPKKHTDKKLQKIFANKKKKRK